MGRHPAIVRDELVRPHYRGKHRFDKGTSGSSPAVEIDRQLAANSDTLRIRIPQLRWFFKRVDAGLYFARISGAICTFFSYAVYPSGGSDPWGFRAHVLEQSVSGVKIISAAIVIAC